jgi:hypothetical protein
MKEGMKEATIRAYLKATEKSEREALMLLRDPEMANAHENIVLALTNIVIAKAVLKSSLTLHAEKKGA